jgi:hypothetical protein
MCRAGAQLSGYRLPYTCFGFSGPPQADPGGGQVEPDAGGIHRVPWLEGMQRLFRFLVAGLGVKAAGQAAAEQEQDTAWQIGGHGGFAFR